MPEFPSRCTVRTFNFSHAEELRATYGSGGIYGHNEFKTAQYSAVQTLNDFPYGSKVQFKSKLQHNGM